MLFHEVPSVLSSMVDFLTVFLLVEVIHQPIRIVEIGGYWSCHGEQIEGYHMKEHKNLYQKLVSKVTLHFVLGHLLRKQTVLHSEHVKYVSLFQGKSLMGSKKRNVHSAGFVTCCLHDNVFLWQNRKFSI